MVLISLQEFQAKLSLTLIWAFHTFSAVGHHLVTLSLRLQFGFFPLVIYLHEPFAVVLQQLIHATPLTHHLLYFFCPQPGVSTHISVSISAKSLHIKQVLITEDPGTIWKLITSCEPGQGTILATNHTASGWP